ncbi:GHMP family kinase ATP-binding protein [Caldiplasma sukawensis]
MTSLELFSPYRISFAGGGTDISPFYEKFGGFVVNTTIDRGVRINYRDDGYPLEVTSRDFLKTSFYTEKAESFQEKIADFLYENGVKKGRIFINGEVPPGSGLASSSAMIVGLLTLAYRITGKSVDPFRLGLDSYEAEKNYFGITLGVQDPFAISIGGFKAMRFEEGSITYLPLENCALRKFIERTMLICYTGATRESSEVLKNQVSKSKEGDGKTIETLNHIRSVAENMYRSCREGEEKKFTELITEGWKLKKSLNRSISGENSEKIINEGMKNGALAARLLGGGSEGFVLLISKEEKLWQVQNELMKVSPFVTRVRPYSGGPIFM